MKQRQREIDWFESQIEMRKNEIEDIQNRLFDAEKLLVRERKERRIVLISFWLFPT